MDGNGRWASERGLPRAEGHRRGVEAVRRAVRSAIELGVTYLTIYSFSTENWSRPKSEVSFLMDLMHRFIRQDVAELHKAGVKIMIIGERVGLDARTLKMIEDAEALTRDNSKLYLHVAFNYGSRQEILRVVKRAAGLIAKQELAEHQMTAEWLSRNLDTGHGPDPDLLIRTGGDLRISNFLLWQCAYAEFVFVPEHWPDFNQEIFQRCITEFHNRERRFGGLKAQSA